MNEFSSEGARDQNAAGPSTPETGQEPGTDLRHPSGPYPQSFPGYGPEQFQFQPERPRPPRLIPNIGHTILFFLIALIMMILTEVGATVIYEFLVHGAHSQTGMDKALALIATNPVFSIPTQAAAYGLLVLLSIPVFEAMWRKPFGEAIRWRARRALRYFWPLLGMGLLAGLVIGSLGNFLPMPKSPPILKDMMTSRLGAWFMLIFGITAAPMTEELAFRGFLLPSLINVFRWGERLGVSTEAVTRWVGIPVAIILTTIPFTLLHAQQVSDAWGPLLLIATVSVILCIVRLATDSVAAGAVVHAAYNFVLFAGVVFQTGGFEHLHKLAR